MANVPPWWHHGMPVFYLVGKAVKHTRHGDEEVTLFKGPMFTEEEVKKMGFRIFGGEFSEFKTTTCDYGKAKAQWRSKQIEEGDGKNISGVLKPIYEAKGD